MSRDWGNASEFVSAIRLITEKKDPEDYVIGTGKSITIKEVLNFIFDFYNLKSEEYVLTSEKYMRPADIIFSKAKPNKIGSDVNWSAKDDIFEVLKVILNAY